MNKHLFSIALLAGGLGLAALAGCNGSNPPTCPSGSCQPTSPPAAAKYTQIELLSRPAVKEAFEGFANHDATNRIEPYGNQSTDPLYAAIGSLTDAFRAPAYGTALQSILYPNEMIADLSQNVPKAAYLGVETGGATGSKFGGRAPSDDVIDISLGALFGNTLSALGVVPDDKKEVPCLTTDNVQYASTTSSTFPYIQGPQ